MSTNPGRTRLYGANVRANGIRQHYLRYGGKGEPLVVLPGISNSAATWDFVAERFGRVYDTYVLDLRGRGLSEAGPDLSYGLDTYAADVAGFAAALGLRRYRVLGHSLGARIVARLAHHHGEALAKAVLVDPPVSGPGRRAYVQTLAFFLDAVREAKAGTIDFEKLKVRYPKWSEDQMRTRAEWLHTCDERAVSESYRGFSEEEIHNDLAAMKTPTLLVVAGKGGVILDEDIAEIRKLMPSIEVRRMDHVGHMIPWEDLDGFVAALEGFVDC
ncbi:MAG: alpha/beta hydrolase [Planctomycetia bacterium]|nr:alpha/beta hydrolase [Planctomycetia bacterium]